MYDEHMEYRINKWLVRMRPTGSATDTHRIALSYSLLLNSYGGFALVICFNCEGVSVYIYEFPCTHVFTVLFMSPTDGQVSVVMGSDVVS